MTYIPPTPAQVRAFLRANNLTGSRAAELAGLNSGSMTRKYTGGAKPHRVSYATWFTWHAKMILPPELLEKIEAAMMADTLD